VGSFRIAPYTGRTQSTIGRRNAVLIRSEAGACRVVAADVDSYVGEVLHKTYGASDGFDLELGVDVEDLEPGLWVADIAIRGLGPPAWFGVERDWRVDLTGARRATSEDVSSFGPGGDEAQIATLVDA